ncbi:MAG: hypothetical protein ACK55X_08690 [Synechococcaceae cyanobacterium]|jgi:hypothetical protein
MTDSHSTTRPGSCLGRTCLKWGSDGERSALDLSLVLERLAQVDQQLTALPQHTENTQPSPSVS